MTYTEPATTSLARDLKAARAKARRAFSRIPRYGNCMTANDTDEYAAWLATEKTCETLRDRLAMARAFSL